MPDPPLATGAWLRRHVGGDAHGAQANRGLVRAGIGTRRAREGVDGLSGTPRRRPAGRPRRSRRRPGRRARAWSTTHRTGVPGAMRRVGAAAERAEHEVAGERRRAAAPSTPGRRCAAKRVASSGSPSAAGERDLEALADGHGHLERDLVEHDVEHPVAFERALEPPSAWLTAPAVERAPASAAAQTASSPAAR